MGNHDHDEIKTLVFGFTLVVILCLLLWYLEKLTQRIENQFDEVDDESFDDLKDEKGLESPVLRSLPYYQYAVPTAMSSPECDTWPEHCIVCLTELKEREWCRALPSCKHVFHLKCIDEWFSEHSTCPLCRDNVGPVRMEYSSVYSIESSDLVEIVVGY